jgi:hypothetical protein
VAFKLTSYVQRERDAQVQDANAMRILMRPGVCWTAVDHGHSFNPTIGRSGKPIGLIEAQLRKARGARSGIPDFLLWADSRAFAIERKIEGGIVSDDQKQFQTELIDAGVTVATCWSQKDVLDALGSWGLLRSYQATA